MANTSSRCTAAGVSSGSVGDAMGQSVGSSPRDEPATGATDSDSVPPRTQFVRATGTSLRSSADMDNAAMDNARLHDEDQAPGLCRHIDHRESSSRVASKR